MGLRAHQARCNRLLPIGRDGERYAQFGARVAGAAFADGCQWRFHRCSELLNLRLKMHGICQTRLQRRDIDDPRQRFAVVLLCIEMDAAILIAMHTMRSTGVACWASGHARSDCSRVREPVLSAYARTSPWEEGAAVGVTKATRKRSRASSNAKVWPTIPPPRIHTSKVCAMAKIVGGRQVGTCLSGGLVGGRR